MRHSDCRLKELKTAAKAEEEALEAEPDHQAVDREFFFPESHAGERYCDATGYNEMLEIHDLYWTRPRHSST